MAACTQEAEPAGDNDNAQAAADTDGTPADQPEVSPSDNLVTLTCADFLATAQVAAAEPADGAALAAQDELANGLTWLHGYLYASSNGAIEPLSQNWMKATVTRVHDECAAAKDPSSVNLFEVAKS